MVRLFLPAALCGVAAAAAAPQRPALEDAVALLQRMAAADAENEPSDEQLELVKTLAAPVSNGWKNMVRTIHEFNTNSREGGEKAWSIAGNAVKRALPKTMQNVVDDVAETAIKEEWASKSKNRTANDIAAKVLKLAWAHGEQGQGKLQQKFQQALQLVSPDVVEKTNRAMNKLELTRKAIEGRMTALAGVASQTIPGVMQQVMDATQQVLHASQAQMQPGAGQPSLPWASPAQQPAGGVPLQQGAQYYQPMAPYQPPPPMMPQMPPAQYGQPQQFGQPQQMPAPYGQQPQMPVLYGQQPLQMPAQYGQQIQQVPYGQWQAPPQV